MKNCILASLSRATEPVLAITKHWCTPSYFQRSAIVQWSLDFSTHFWNFLNCMIPFICSSHTFWCTQLFCKRIQICQSVYLRHCYLFTISTEKRPTGRKLPRILSGKQRSHIRLLPSLTKDHVSHLDMRRHTSNTMQDSSLPGAGKGWR